MTTKMFKPLAASAALAGMLMLSGCGASLDPTEAQIERAELAAKAAQAAQLAAERAARKAEAYSRDAARVGAYDPPSKAERDMEKASQDPNSAYFDPMARMRGG